MNAHTSTKVDASRPPLLWRAYRPDDLDAIREIFGGHSTGLAGSALQLLVGDTDPWEAAVAVDDEQELQALSLVTVANSGCTHSVARSFATPQVLCKPLWGQALSWQLETARKLNANGRGTLEVHVHPGQAGLDAVLRANGFSWYNSTIEMTKGLDELPEMPDLGPYIMVEDWDETHVSASRRLLNRLLVDEPEGAAISRLQWEGQCQAAHPGWSHVLVDKSGDRPQVQGFVLASSPPEEEDAQSTGVIDMVAVADTVGSSEYFQSLTLASLLSQKAAGITTATVTVDEPGDPFTTRLYQNLGFENSYEVRSFTTTL